MDRRNRTSTTDASIVLPRTIPMAGPRRTKPPNFVSLPGPAPRRP